MSAWKMKRFWTAASVSAVEGGFTVTLDGRSIKTPAKAALVVPTRALAEEIAKEWDAQEKDVDPSTMPFTRTANSAIDKLSVQMDEVVEIISEYGSTDMLCYRAEGPAELIERQARVWQPLLDRAASELGAPLTVAHGVMYVPQPEASLRALSDIVRSMTTFQLAAFHDLVALSGSLVIGIAAARDWDSTDALWSASRLDESWQIEQWGKDGDAAEVTRIKRAEFEFSKQFFDLVR